MVVAHYRIAYAVHRLDHAMGVAFDTALRPLGISPAQAAALLHLDRYPAASMAELSRLASVTPQTMHRLVVGLERRGLVQRRPLDDDRKALQVAITARGAQVLRQAETELRKEQDVILEYFTPAELDRFAEFLDRLEQAYAGQQAKA